MANNEYHFITEWNIPGTLEEVLDILGDIHGLPRWWPSVYLGVEELERGDENGVGKRVALYTKGWLPYTLRWQFRVAEVNPPGHIRIDSIGDFIGRGIWTLTQHGENVNIIYDWKISAQKPILKRLSFLLKPIFSMNHHWAMEKGEESLRLELLRRRAQKNGEPVSTVPPPPRATPSQPLAWLGYVLSRSRG
jgi:hypothetical protein